MHWGSAFIKAARKMLMKSTSGVNFIHILHAAVTLVDPKSITFQLSHQYLFTLLRSTLVKATQKMLMKSTPGPLSLTERGKKKVKLMKRENRFFFANIRSIINQ
jgi:hypothetical protein